MVGVVYTFVKHIFRLDYSFARQLNPILVSLTLLVDGLANVCVGELFNDLFLKKKLFSTHCIDYICRWALFII